MMKKTLDLEARLGVKVRGLVTWAFLFDQQPYFAGYRVLSSNDVHLPVLNAFKLLGSLGGDRLPVTSSGALTVDQILASSVRGQADVDAMATLDAGRVQVIVWNYHDDLVAAASSPVHLSVQLPVSFGTRTMVSHLRVDETHGDPYTVWVSQGSPSAPSAAQIAAMQQAMQPAALQPPQEVDVVGHAASVDFDLPRFGVSLVTVAPVGAVDGGTTDGSVGDSAPPATGAVTPPGDGGSRAGTPSVDGSPGDGSSGEGGPAAGGGGAPVALDGSAGPGGSPGSREGGSAGMPAHGSSGGCACDLATGDLSRDRGEGVLLLLPLFWAARRRSRDEGPASRAEAARAP